MEKEYWLVVVSAILYGAITAGAQFFVGLGLSLYEISFYRAFFIGIALLPVALIRTKYLVRREMMPFFVVFGLIGALGALGQFGGIVFGVPVAIVAFLLYTQPIWTIVLGKLMLNEKITYRKMLAICIALLGFALLLEPWKAESIGSIAGVISAVLGGLFLSLWIILGRKSGIAKQHPVTVAIGWSWFSALWLLLLLPLASLFVDEQSIIRLSFNFPLHYWLYLLVFAVIAGALPHVLFYKGVQKIHASIAGIILLLEPVSATILAAIFFGQPAGFNIISGGALILLSNYLVIRER